jgi:hypothetical protein
MDLPGDLADRLPLLVPHSSQFAGDDWSRENLGFQVFFF